MSARSGMKDEGTRQEGRSTGFGQVRVYGQSLFSKAGIPLRGIGHVGFLGHQQEWMHWLFPRFSSKPHDQIIDLRKQVLVQCVRIF